jgi:hypothetical protein
LEAQVLKLMPLHPDDYAIEESPTDAARRRVSERLEGLSQGDRICVSSINAFHGPAKDMLGLISNLVSRGVVIETFADNGEVVEVGQSKSESLLISWLSQIFVDCDKPMRRRMPAANLEMLSDSDVAEIRRLARAGLTSRRIGMIFRRSPRCIEGVLSDASMSGEACGPNVTAARG